MFGTASLQASPDDPATARPRLDGGDIHVWRARAGALARPLAPPCLDTAERERAERLRIPGHRDAFVFAHTFKRAVLGAYLGQPPRQLSFGRGAGGKPHLSDPDLQFNLSHTGDAVVMAVALATPVGIDLEHGGRRIDAQALAAACLSAAETRALDAIAASHRKAGLLRQWTRKEALLKALGSGLASDPCELDLAAAMGSQGTFAVDHAGRAWVSIDIGLGEDWLASLAYEGTTKTVRGFCLGW